MNAPLANRRMLAVLGLTMMLGCAEDLGDPALWDAPIRAATAEATRLEVRDTADDRLLFAIDDAAAIAELIDRIEVDPTHFATCRCAGDYALVGFDLKKDIEVLLAAYNDKSGVTSAFNLNLLERINRELGGDFDVSTFRHFGTYNVFSGAMESYLVSLVPQVVTIAALELSFAFDAWEPIHTEYSYKYLRSDITRLAAGSGFSVQRDFEDERGWFVDSLWRAEHTIAAPTPER